MKAISILHRLSQRVKYSSGRNNRPKYLCSVFCGHTHVVDMCDQPAKTKTNNVTEQTNKVGPKVTNESRRSDETASPTLTFVSHPNAVTGKMEWVVRDEDYDYQQEIARSGYGDMLHDKDRNVKYYEAIKQAVKLLKDQNKVVKALDVGTGTGLLSMMAAVAGADRITACEAFPPMANCAEKVIDANGFKDKIKVIHKRSTDLSVDDVGERANLLVTELFDTELIGEGAVGSYTDVHERFMEEDCIAVPATGIMYVQAVQCDLLRKWNSLQVVELPNGTTVSPPASFSQCAGVPSLHDLQVDELEGHLQFVSPPVEVFRFDFSHRNALKKNEQSTKTVAALQAGSVDAFIMWWDLVMDPKGEIILSCAPCWQRKKGEAVPWRDHWMQALYYPPTPLAVKKDETFDILSYHDEYSLWFSTEKTESLRPVCTCGMHVAFSRSRLGQMNDAHRNAVFIKALEKHITSDTVCLVISDGSLLPLFAAKLGARKVFYLDTNWLCREKMKEMVDHNGLQDRVIILDKIAERITAADLENQQVDLVIAEPHTQAAHLPWEHLYFWYAVNSLQRHMSPDVVILPKQMKVRAMAVQFRDLHKIRSPVGNCEGFDISEFDRLIEASSASADEEIEPQPLWEYPSTALSPPATVLTVNMTQAVDSMDKTEEMTEIQCNTEGALNGITFWSEYDFGDGLNLSTGLVNDKEDSKKFIWDMFSRQGVQLLRHAITVTPSSKLKISSQFTAETGDFSFYVKFL